MGVKGLWRLLLPIGRRISIETLAGQTLAIDASIWLTQFLKAMRDPETGQANRSAHLIGFFRRICKLKFHRIRPVFVFDGATPEIKRAEVLRRKRKRDQFAERATDASLQRLAKKLLTETLQKQKMSKQPQGGAFVAGFNPGQQNHHMSPSSNGNSIVDNRKEAPVSPSDGQDDAPATNTDNSVLQDETNIELEKDLFESIGEPDESQRATSDWDLPLAVAAAEEAKELELAEQSQSSFSVEHVSSLPAVLRKDAVEKARRDQRLRSRKEFMPAAANPVNFSNVQVRNFLKHCKLNKDIVKMAEKAAKQENDGNVGEAMASDRTTRVELIRENDEEDNDGPKSLLAEKLAAKKRVAKKHAPQSRINRFSHADSSSDEDDGVDWQNTTEPASTPTGRNGKRRVLDDDSSSSDEGAGGGFLVPDQGRRKAPSAPTEQKPAPIIRLDEDSEDTQGRFVRPGGGKRSGAIAASPELLMIRSSDEDSDSNEEEGGGFLKTPYKDLGGTNSDARIAQELQDRELALALENEEENSAEKSSRQEGTDDEVEFVRTENQRKGSSEVGDAESSEEDLDWEDGEDTVDNSQILDSVHDTKVVKETVSTSNTESDRKPAFDPGLDTDPFEETRGSPADEQSPDFASTKGPMSPEASEALAQAEKTASNLTNWAGRAFRRAVREAGGSEKPVESPHVSTNRADVAHLSGAESDTGSSSGGPSPEKDQDSREKSRHFGGSAPSPRRANRAEEKKQAPVDWSFLEDGSADAGALSEAKRRERDADTISDEMLLEAKQLLRLFGIPYVEAPAEAEAQCAALEQLGLVDGIVTEDSDVFVFGGRKVYKVNTTILGGTFSPFLGLLFCKHKNIFDDQKYAEAYVSTDAEREMNLGRNAMVALAMLLGGDYTEGVKGVGIVNAMELLSAFDVSEDLTEGLSAFRKWLDGFDPALVAGAEKADASNREQTREERFHQKHKSARTRWSAPDNFPSNEVIKAYMEPVVDNSTERFSWGEPDYPNLTMFCNQQIGWTPEHIKRLLEPVIEAQNSGPRQTRIDSFMKYQDSIKFADVRSKRLRDVLEGINAKDKEE